MAIDLNTLHSDECPSLVLELQSLLTALAEKTNQRICDESQILFDLMSQGDAALQTNITALETTVNSLSNVPDFTNQINSLTNLINSLDLDQDGSVANDLLNIQGTADSAMAQVAEMATRADVNAANIGQNNALINQLSQAFATFQTAVNTSLESLAQRMNSAESNISTLQAELQALQAQVADFGQHSAGEVYCAMTTALKNAAPAFLAAFDTALGQPCNIGGTAAEPETGSIPSFG